LRKVAGFAVFAASRILKISTDRPVKAGLSPVNDGTACYANQVLEPRVPELRIDESGYRGYRVARRKSHRFEGSNPRIKLDALDSHGVHSHGWVSVKR
jgi:hypothetical protein